jgi:hypothetical protein
VSKQKASTAMAVGGAGGKGEWRMTAATKEKVEQQEPKQEKLFSELVQSGDGKWSLARADAKAGEDGWVADRKVVIPIRLDVAAHVHPEELVQALKDEIEAEV